MHANGMADMQGIASVVMKLLTLMLMFLRVQLLLLAVTAAC